MLHGVVNVPVKVVPGAYTEGNARENEVPGGRGGRRQSSLPPHHTPLGVQQLPPVKDLSRGTKPA